ncbi:MAG: NAD(+)/NADH kinase [Lachnospiraceae bacterium]|jgi:NAD+ kinase
MKKFCVVVNTDKNNACLCAEQISKYITDKGLRCDIIENCMREKNNHIYYTDCDSISKDTECVIVLGGDGTMIQAAHDIAAMDVPIFGINLGGLGYLTESDPGNMWSDIDRLIADDYRIEKRMMLDGIIKTEKGIYTCMALNDFVVNKHDIGKLIGCEVYVNDELLDSFFADGIIVSTPTGSTGYNLSAGGPVMSPQIESICVTPICPHSLNDRSFVISGSDSVSIKLTKGKNSDVDSAIVVSDGRRVADIVTGEEVLIKKSECYTKIVLKEETNFYKRVRSKLN